MTQSEIITMAMERAYSEMEQWKSQSLIGLNKDQIEFLFSMYLTARKRYTELKDILYGRKEIEK